MSDPHNAQASKTQDDDIYRVPDDLLEAKSGTPPSYPSGSRRSKRSRGGGKRMWVIAAIVVVVLAAGGAAAYLAMHKSHKTTTQTTKTTSRSSSESSSSGQGQTPVDTSTKHYVSSETALNLAFDYPDSWQVSPPTTTSAGTSPITVDSMPFTFTNAAGASVTGKVTITIRPASAGIAELKAGSPTVAQDSVQMGYTHPAAHQHQYPYLTFIHLPNGSAVAGSFEEVMITGVSGFSKGAPITADTLTGLDPVISVNFYTCTTSACSGTTATAASITNDAWANNAMLKQVQTTLDSLVLN